MQFKSITFILACTIATSAMASPLAAGGSDERTELYREDASNGGSLVYYGAAKLRRSEPAFKDSDERTELYREDASNGGSLVYYGPAKSRRSETRLEQRWFWQTSKKGCDESKEPTCSTSHTARNGICDKLLAELELNSNVKVGENPRQICYKGEAIDKNDACCLSWRENVPNLTKGDLIGHGYKILRQCTSDGISGKLVNVKVHDTCTDFCLSSRGTNC